MKPPQPRLVPTLAVAALTALATLASAGAPAAVCQARSAPIAPTVVELYTSEGCSSCPPADRWLSTLKARGDIVALAFHVPYWDSLGWADRFADPAYAERQRALARRNGNTTVYTPQVIVDGQDWRRWPALPTAARPGAVSAQLVRDGDVYTLSTQAGPGAPARLAGYWAVVEDGHASRVRAGENTGQTLHHDHVVRLFKPVAPWNAAEAGRAELQVSRGAAEFPRRVVFVVTDAVTAQPLQAVTLAC